VVAAACAALLAGCGSGDGDGADETTESTTIELKIYEIRLGRLWPTRRVVAFTESVERAALDELLEGPTDKEFEEFDLRNYVGADLQGLRLEGSLARVEATANLREDGLGQVVFTLTQFPAIRSVEVATPESTRTYRRADFEKFTPPILVEEPLVYETVSSPLHVSGTANTFEATFSYELKDARGRVIAEDFVTATSGTGRGTFEFSVPFEVGEDHAGSLIVFERSAKDGSRTNLVEIPLRMSD
jgi:Immunoglobulin-like domain of bacterial spore germination/Sporulation and spore germination